jgi:hypothetical protein
MKFTIKTKVIIIAVLLAILTLLFFGYKLGRRTGERVSDSTLSALKGQLSKYEIELGDKTLYISQINQQIESLKQAKADGEVTAKELRALNLKQVNEINRLKIGIDTLLTNVSHTSHIISIPVTSVDTVQHYAIQLPFTFARNDQWLSLNGNFDAIGKLDIDLKMSADISVYTGVDKVTKKPTCLLSTNNPYLKTLNLSSYKFDTPKDKKYSISLFIGYGVSKTGLSPIAGLGIGRSILKF